MKNYPKAAIENYRAGKISRREFMAQFSQWQKSQGMSFDTKGTADKNGIYLTYRGITAKIENGKLRWNKATAADLFTFQRQVDYAINQELQEITNACYYSDKAYNASRANDYEARAEYDKKKFYFLERAKKWAALWN